MSDSLELALVGTWQLTSWTYVNERGQTVDFFGSRPIGILVYDAAGRVSAQIMRSDGPRLHGSPVAREESPSGMVDAYRAYAAYFGTYIVTRPGEFVNVVEGSLWPHWVGTRQVRYAKLSGDLLTLTTPPVLIAGVEAVFTLTWQRVV